MQTCAKGILYDAAAVSPVLGLPAECVDSIPEAADGEVVIYYGGWTLQQLRESPASKRSMWDQEWYDQYGWRAEAGYYHLRLPVPGSNRKTFAEQKTLLLPGEDVAPVTVAAMALLVHLAATGIDLLSTGWCRCNELLSDGDRAELAVDDGRVYVGYDWDGLRHDRVWVAGARKC